MLTAARVSDQLKWHERVRAALDFRIQDPNFVLWIVVQAEPRAGLDDDALRREIEGWLRQLDPDRVAQQRDEPEHTWDAEGLIVRLTAVPKKPEARTTRLQIVGNPVPSSAYGSGVIRSSSHAVHRL